MSHGLYLLLQLQLIQRVWFCFVYLWMCCKASVTKGQLQHFFINI